MNFTDAVALTGVKLTSEGYLVADAFAVRTGIQHYAGHEVGHPDKAIVAVYRPESEVFHRDSLASFSHVPVTNEHPRVAVTADNWKDLAIGEASSEVLRDGHRLKIPLILKDAAGIKAVQDGKRQLSAGYSCELDFKNPGITEDGIAYDAVQRNIRANHIAIVPAGRAGPEFRIGDSAASWGASPIIDHQEQKPMTLRNILVDGLNVETTENGAIAIGKLQTDCAKLTTDLANATAAHAAAVTAKDTEIGTLRAQLQQAKDALPSGAMLDKLVQDRAALVTSAQAIVKDFNPAGLSDADIRRAVVKAKLGDAAVADANDDTVLGMFRALSTTDGKQTLPADPVRQAMQVGDQRQQVTDNGQSTYEKRLQDAWKTPAVTRAA